jgi:hypothetical protein
LVHLKKQQNSDNSKLFRVKQSLSFIYTILILTVFGCHNQQTTVCLLHFTWARYAIQWNKKTKYNHAEGKMPVYNLTILETEALSIFQTCMPLFLGCYMHFNKKWQGSTSFMGPSFYFSQFVLSSTNMGNLTTVIYSRLSWPSILTGKYCS